MDLEYISKLINLISTSEVDELEIEEDGKKIRITKAHSPSSVPQQMTYTIGAPPIAVNPGPNNTNQSSQSQAVAQPEVALPSTQHEVKSPIVGTFYRSPAPDAPPFIKVGDMVSKGSVLCIVEAMKLMNEIESDVAGKVVQIMVENGDPIEYDQVLFLVEPA